MKKYRVSFYGRQRGAIGIFYQIVDTYEAKDIHYLMSLLYEDYDHLRDLTVKINNKEIEVPQKINWVKVRSYTERERSPKTGSYKYTQSDAPKDYNY